MISGNSIQEQLSIVTELANAGRRNEALAMLDAVLRQAPDNPAAWRMMVRLASTRSQAMEALQQLQRLEPDNVQVRELIERLESGSQEERKRDRLTYVWLIGAGAAALIFILFLIFIFVRPIWQGPEAAGSGQEVDELALEEVADLPLSNCQGLVDRALGVSDQSCRQIGANQVCYGNYRLDAVLSTDTAPRFALVGDVVDVQSLLHIMASPLDPAAGQWGIAVFKLQADVARTIPGQAVTFLVFGDTSVDNVSGDMHAFYFSTGFGAVTCAQVAFDGILIDMPDGSSLSFRANGAELTLSGSTNLQARSGEEMTVSMLSGEGSVQSAGEEQTLTAGQELSVPLGGDSGLEASGPPSTPRTLPDAVTTLACLLIGQNCPEEVAEEPEASEEAEAIPTNTSVPVDSSLPTNTPVPVAPGQPTNTPVPLPTNTSVPPSTRTPTELRSPTPTRTPQPGLPVATNTSAPPNTQVPTSTPVPSITPVPTNTPVPTATPQPTTTPLPTNTEPPAQGSCSNINISWADPVKFDIRNEYGSPIILTKIELTWDDFEATGQLKQVTLSGPALAAGNLGGPDVSISLSGNTDKRTVSNDNTKTLSFTFEEVPVGEGYSVGVTFDVGCTRSASH